MINDCPEISGTDWYKKFKVRSDQEAAHLSQVMRSMENVQKQILECQKRIEDETKKLERLEKDAADLKPKISRGRKDVRSNEEMVPYALFYVDSLHQILGQQKRLESHGEAQRIIKQTKSAIKIIFNSFNHRFNTQEVDESSGFDGVEMENNHCASPSINEDSSFFKEKLLHILELPFVLKAEPPNMDVKEAIDFIKCLVVDNRKRIRAILREVADTVAGYGPSTSSSCNNVHGTNNGSIMTSPKMNVAMAMVEPLPSSPVDGCHDNAIIHEDLTDALDDDASGVSMIACPPSIKMKRRSEPPKLPTLGKTGGNGVVKLEDHS